MEKTQNFAGLELDAFNGASLPYLESLNLLSRFDTKFVVPLKFIPEIVCSLCNDYSMLEIGGNRMFHYTSRYFDTPDYFFYRQHHNGWHTRSKVRYRHYEETGIYHFEIKNKSNCTGTTKEIMNTNCLSKSICGGEADFLRSKLGMEPSWLLPKLSVSYNRINLIGKNCPEKVTIDLNINFVNTVNRFSLDELALIEVKQKRVDNSCPLMKKLKSLNIHKTDGFSKYCIGLALTDSKVKYNRFKPKLLIIKKLSEN